MTEKQALAEAQKRWGELARVRRFGKTGTPNSRWVGVWNFLRCGKMIIKGTGSTWEEAFADVDRRRP